MYRYIITLIIYLVCVPFSFAYDFEEDNLWFYLPKSGSTLQLAGGRERSGNLIIPETITYRNRTFTIGFLKDYAFQGCTFNDVSIPSTIKNISKGSFRNAGINQLRIAEGVENIGMSAFEDSKIIDLFIPNSVSRIEDNAFRDSKNLKNITIGTGLEFIHWGAFQRCNQIESIICYASNPPSEYVTEIDNYGKPIFDNTVYQFAVLKVPAISIGKYKTSSPWKNFHTIEPISENSLTEYEKLSIEWDMLNYKYKQIDPDIYRLSAGHADSFYAYYFSESLDKKGKVKIKKETICNPLGDWSDGRYTNNRIALGEQKDGEVGKRFMLHGSIKLTDDSDYEQFFSAPLDFPYNEPIVFNCITSSGKPFTMQIHKEIGQRYEISPINKTGERDYLISLLPSDANFKVIFIDNQGVEHKILIALKNIPHVFIPK